MSWIRLDFTCTTDTATGYQLATNEVNDNAFGPRGEVREFRVIRSAGDGTQWEVYTAQGFTGDASDEALGYVTVPSTAADWSGPNAGFATFIPTKPRTFEMDNGNYPDGWTDASTPKAGLGLYVALKRVGGTAVGSTADTIELGLRLERKGNC